MNDGRMAKFVQAIETICMRDSSVVATWEQILNGLVYEQRSPADLHASGLRLSHLVARSNLPGTSAGALAGRRRHATAFPEPGRLPRLRQRSRELPEGGHPLRRFLAMVRTLDTVRMIEGKA